MRRKFQIKKWAFQIHNIKQYTVEMKSRKQKKGRMRPSLP